MSKTIIIVGTLDTKADEVNYINELLKRKGHKTVIMDPGILGKAPFEPDITRDQVAEAAGASLKKVVEIGDEGEAIVIMAKGASKIVQELYSSGRLDGIVVLGGSMGTSLGLPVLKALPLLVPKLMVSTMAFTQVITSEAAGADLTVMPTVADIWGLNRITRRVLENAAGAISGMAESYNREERADKSLIGVTTLGFAGLRYVPIIKPLLEQGGYEVAVFHTNGVGGRTFEQFVEDGLFAGVLDLSQQELMGFVCGGPTAVDRLEAFGKRSIPKVITPGAIDFFGWLGLLETLPAKYSGRTIHRHNTRAAEIKTNNDEKTAVGELMAKKLNKALGPTVVLIPTQGFCERDKPGSLLYDPEGRKVFIEALKKNIKPGIKVKELDMHINDPEFAQEAVVELKVMINEQAKI